METCLNPKSLPLPFLLRATAAAGRLMASRSSAAALHAASRMAALALRRLRDAAYARGPSPHAPPRRRQRMTRLGPGSRGPAGATPDAAPCVGLGALTPAVSRAGAVSRARLRGWGRHAAAPAAAAT